MLKGNEEKKLQKYKLLGTCKQLYKTMCVDRKCALEFCKI